MQTNAVAENEFERLTRAHRTLSSANRTLIRATDENALLNDICRIIVEHGYRMTWVGYARQDAEKSIVPVASAGTGDDFLSSAHFTWADSDTGVTGPAVRTGQPQAGRNILDDPAMAKWRDQAMRQGFASASAFPLRINGQVEGNLTIYAAEPDAFDQREIELLDELADDLGFGIETLRLRAKHQEAQQALARMAYFDVLTGLPNRLQMSQDLEHGIAAARQQRRPLGLLYLEVGRFREINETLGYVEGDRLLQEVGARLSAAMDGIGTVARVGEAEFAVLLPKCTSRLNCPA